MFLFQFFNFNSNATETFCFIFLNMKQIRKDLRKKLKYSNYALRFIEAFESKKFNKLKFDIQRFCT